MDGESAAVLRRFIDEAWNGRRSPADLVAPDYRTAMLQLDSVDTGDELGPEYVARDVAVWTEAFPDLHWHVDEVVEEGPAAAARLRWTGTHQGTFLGIPPTGVAIVVHASYSAHIHHGRIVRGWLLWDRLGLLQQLGVLPDTGALLRS